MVHAVGVVLGKKCDQPYNNIIIQQMIAPNEEIML
jgi:hypothetical protein